MSRMFVYAAADVRPELLELLNGRFGTHRAREMACDGLGDLVCIWDDGAGQPGEPPADHDIVIVAGSDFPARVGRLLERGLHNLFDGNAILAERTPAFRFLQGAARHYTGPRAPEGDGVPMVAAARFDTRPLAPGAVPADRLFIVNSMPKSGTIWMCAMLEALLGVKTNRQITVSHVGDIEDDWNKPNNHGAVALVRDMRDVVVSWFHNVQRTDLALGFAAPRYPTIDSFYDEHFLSTIRVGKRFYGGDFERWLDLVGANYIPIIRYEDLSADTPAALRKLATFWRIEVDDETLRHIAAQHGLKTMGNTVAGGTGYVAELVRGGHIRRGRHGGWRDELPERIARDIEQRFAGYQNRLGYR